MGGGSCQGEGIPGTKGLQTCLVPRAGLVGRCLQSHLRDQVEYFPTVHVQELAEQELHLRSGRSGCDCKGAGKL